MTNDITILKHVWILSNECKQEENTKSKCCNIQNHTVIVVSDRYVRRQWSVDMIHKRKKKTLEQERVACSRRRPNLNLGIRTCTSWSCTHLEQQRSRRYEWWLGMTSRCTRATQKYLHLSANLVRHHLRPDTQDAHLELYSRKTM